MAMLNNQRVSYSDCFLYIPIRSPLEFSSYGFHTHLAPRSYSKVSASETAKKPALSPIGF